VKNEHQARTVCGIFCPPMCAVAIMLFPGTAETPETLETPETPKHFEPPEHIERLELNELPTL